MSSPFIPCSFSYGDIPQGGQVTPQITAARNPSNTIDKNYISGTLWLSDLAQGGSGNMYYQGGNSSGLPNWTLFTNAGGVLNSLSDGTTTVTPSGGNIAIIGTGNQIGVVAIGASHELNLFIPNTFIAPGSIASTTTLTAGSTLTVTSNASIGGNLTLTGSETIGGNLTVTGSITLGGLTVEGTVLINDASNSNTTIGSITGSGIFTLNAPTGGLQVNGGGNSVDIANDAAANTVVLGSTNTTSSTHIQSGTGNLTIDGSTTAQIALGSTSQTGTITIGRSTAGQAVNIASAVNTVSQTIQIGNGTGSGGTIVQILSGVETAATSQLYLADSPRVTQVDIGNVAPAATRNIYIGACQAAAPSQTDNVHILDGLPSTGTNTLSIINGITTGGTQRINIFSTTAASTLQEFDLFNGANTNTTNTVNIAGSGATGTKVTTNIGTGAAAHVLNVGSTSGGNITMTLAAGSAYAIAGGTTTTMSIGGSSVTTGTLLLGGSASTGNITLGSTSGASQSVLIANGAGATGIVSIGNVTTAGMTVNIAGATTIATASSVNVLNGATPSAVLTLNILNGISSNVTTGQVVNILGGANTTGTQAFNLFNGAIAGATSNINMFAGVIASGTNTLNILTSNNTGGTNAVNVLSNNSTAVAGTINLGTGTSAAHIVNVGSALSTTTIKGNIVTAPVAASVATVAFGSSLTVGTALQNTTGYDVLLNIVVQVSAATTSTLTLGVGTTNSPTLQTAVPSFTVVSATFFTIFAYVPNNYYVKVGQTGTPTVTNVTVVAMGI